MVTRPLNQAYRRDVQDVGTAFVGLGRGVQSVILPALGLNLAFGLLTGGANDATASGRAASSAMFQMQSSMFGLQEAITRAVLPAILEITPYIANIADLITDADEATDGWSTRLGLAGAAAYLLRGRLAPLVGAAGGAAAGALGRFAVPGGAAIGAGAGAGVGAAGVAGAAAGAAGVGLIGAAGVGAYGAFSGNPTGIGPVDYVGNAVARHLSSGRDPEDLVEQAKGVGIYIQNLFASDREQTIRMLRELQDQGALGEN